MARNYMFCRQDAEDLVDLLEANADFQIHDHTAGDIAKELREMFGMSTREQEAELKAKCETGPRQKLELNVEIFEAPDFSLFRHEKPTH